MIRGSIPPPGTISTDSLELTNKFKNASNDQLMIMAQIGVSHLEPLIKRYTDLMASGSTALDYDIIALEAKITPICVVVEWTFGEYRQRQPGYKPAAFKKPAVKRSRRPSAFLDNWILKKVKRTKGVPAKDLIISYAMAHDKTYDWMKDRFEKIWESHR
jgi:hypothetical protein